VREGRKEEGKEGMGRGGKVGGIVQL